MKNAEFNDPCNRFILPTKCSVIDGSDIDVVQ
jgi:hypothetical protein